MIREQLNLFAGRQEAIALFENLCERQEGEPWSFLPILSMVGPSGYGKSLFIQNLYLYYCHTPSLPHISLDFGRPDAPHDLLNILGALRNSLRRQRDGYGHALAFPRFDIIYARLKRSEGQESEEVDEVNDVNELFGEFSDLIGLVGNIHVALGLLLFIVKFVARLPPLRTLLRWLVEWAYQRAGNQPQWRWYQDQIRKFRELNLPGNASVGSIRRRLNEMCTIGGPEREFLIEQILPKAFLADLRYGDSDNESSLLKKGPRYIVIFLDSFEVLLRGAEPTARQLLEVLALNEYRKRGESDPLLLIVGSEERLPDMSREQLNQHFPPPSNVDAGRRSAQQRAEVLYDDWMRQVPSPEDRRALKLRNIYLPLPLSTLQLDGTRDYLLRLDQHNETSIFANEALVEDIHRVTQDYPIFLERVAAALQASAQDSGPAIGDVRELFDSEQGEQIIDRLLTLHCKQVDERAFMLSAIPRTLTPELLSLVLEHLYSGPPAANVLNAEWRRYRHLPFLLASEDKRSITFVAGIRALFLQKLHMVTAESDSDYVRLHQRLHDYFKDRIAQSLRTQETFDEQDLLERSYHALALGDYQSVVQLATYAQRDKPDLWKGLLKVIAQAPTEKLPHTEVRQQASEGLYRAQQQAKTAGAAPEAVRAIVLCTWLLAAPGSERKRVSSLWYDLGMAYQYLQEVDPRVQRDAATHCFQRANELLDPPQPVTGKLLPPGPTAGGPVPSPGRGVGQLVRSTYRSVRANRWVLVLLGIILLGAMLAPWLVLRVPPRPRAPSATANPFALPLADLQPGARNRWIGATVEPDGEFVGLSDGSIPFDYLRPDGSLKVRAAGLVYRGDLAGARVLLEKAVQSDVNDAEALIYLQDIQIRLAGKACSVFVVATRIIEDSSEGVNNGRDNLQGAYVAQKEYNDTHPTPLCLYIANLGNNSGYEPFVAQQLVNAAAASKGALVGLTGWPGLLDNPDSLAAVHLLEKARLPIISPDSYDVVQFVSNVFHIVPSRQAQGRRAALYAEHVLQKTHAVIITDPANPYSRSLTEGFIQQFEGDGNQILAIQTYATGLTDARTLAVTLQAEERLNPDFIYFAGGIGEGSVLLAQLRADSSPLRLLGSEQLYPFVGFSANARPGFDRLAFTSSAYVDTPVASHMEQLYALAFDAQDPGRVRVYGYSRPDSEAILSYDAMETLIAAYTNAAGIQRQSLEQVLPSVRIEGASRQFITFTRLNELSDQHLFVLYVNQQEQVSFSTI
ncbi:MAG: ABC transporter substrate-binding protein [Ktedonobacteraceae bacterium]|nr:ABC transporter substrate-binding protein [Ktedonobacteraceae bacterium]